MRHFLTALLTLSTGIGGHFINRRWDKAIFFFSLAVVSFALLYWAFFFQINNLNSSNDNPLETSVLSGMDSIILNFAVFYISLLLISTISAFIDSQKTNINTTGYWTILGVFGSFFMTLFMTGFSVLFLSILGFYSSQNLSESSLKPHVNHSGTFASSFFFLNETFGGFDHSISSPLPLPKGNHSIDVLFTYNNKPAKGISARFNVNGKYRTDLLTTDENGTIHIPVKENINYINSLSIEKWENAPVKSKGMIIITGEESKAHKDYSKYDWFYSKGIQVNTSNDSSNPVVFHLKPTIKILWPTKDSNETPVKIENAMIKWSPVKQAEYYIIDVKNLEREGSSTTYRSVASRKVSVSSLELATLKTTTVPESSFEYTVKISAFKSDGSFINESALYNQASFVLADGKSIVEDSLTHNQFEDIDYQQLREVKKRLSVVDSLIDEGSLDLASNLLDTIHSDYKQGKRYALQALILAKRNKCEEASALIKKSIKRGGCKCSIKKTQELCPSNF